MNTILNKVILLIWVVWQDIMHIHQVSNLKYITIVYIKKNYYLHSNLIFYTGSVYNASKYAIRGFTEAARHDLAATPIRVTHISPGLH